MLIKSRFTDEEGKLLPEYPTFNQFRYFYRKTRKMQNYYISRDGLKDYQRNNRPLTGDGVQEYANRVGIGMLDSTICDIYLINEAGQLVGRPLLAAAVDAYSGICMGYTLSWEGGVYSLKALTAPARQTLRRLFIISALPRVGGQTNAKPSSGMVRTTLQSKRR